MADGQNTNTASSAANARTLRGRKRAAEVLGEGNTSGTYECQDLRDNTAVAGPSHSGLSTVSTPTTTTPVDQFGLVNLRIDRLFEELRDMKRAPMSPGNAPLVEPGASVGTPCNTSQEEELVSDSSNDEATAEATDAADAMAPGSVMQYMNTLTSPPDDQPNGIDEDLTRVLKELTGVFQANEEKGEAIDENLAKIFNNGLRSKPVYSALKSTMDRYKAPLNVPNLRAPATNEDVSRAMNNIGKFLDSQLLKNGALMAKGMIPIMQMINEIATKKDKPLTFYLQHLNDCMVMLMASFNYLNLARVDVARINVRDFGFKQLCNDKALEIGTEQLFPVDVTVKCNELAKRRKLGQVKTFHNQGRGFSHRGRPGGYHGDRQGNKDYNKDYNKEYKNYPNKGKQSANSNQKPDYKPANFLGWKQGKGKFSRFN